jgi:hypothetical protein
MKALGSLLLIGLIVTYWWLALTVLLIFLAAKAAPVAWRELQDERTAQQSYLRGLVTRADTQHAWTAEGDPRGTYGAYTPA